MVRKSVVGMLVVALLAAPVAGEVPRVDPAWAGHYYLSGVMETGSELLLRPDGTFAWMLVYGALDQEAEGRWDSDGRTITLRVAMPDPASPEGASSDPGVWRVRPFNTLHLRIEGRALIPVELGRGRYERARSGPG